MEPAHATGTAGRLHERATDLELYRRYRECGDRTAMDALVRRWHAVAYSLARTLCRDEQLAQDVVQDTFLILLGRHEPYRDSGQQRFRSWFLKVVTNKARMALRTEHRAGRKKRVDAVSFARRKGLDTEAPGTGRLPEMRQAVVEALGSLADPWREAVRMHYVMGLKQKEVASRLGVSQQLISRRLRTGLGLLRGRLDECLYVCEGS